MDPNLARQQDTRFDFVLVHTYYMIMYDRRNFINLKQKKGLDVSYAYKVKHALFN